MAEEKKALSNVERQRKYAETHDRVPVWLDKGTLDRIKALGYTGNAFIKEATMEKLEKLEKDSKKL